jgi:hypothetical protein
MKIQLPVARCIAIIVASLPLSLAYADEHDSHAVDATSAEPQAQLLVDAPLTAPLAHGVVVVPFHTEHLKIVPVYGAAASGVVPRIGHLHISVDHASWHWLHSSEEPIVIQGLSHGPHQLTLELADANHHRLAIKELDFTIP